MGNFSDILFAHSNGKNADIPKQKDACPSPSAGVHVHCGIGILVLWASRT